ncbi:MAG: DUF2007 domain-containing protein [Bacteroidales bacterium]|nr:DUF2007 domain-containing protein [Bacteroidales bacterium]
MKSDEEIRPAEVFAGTIMQASMVKSLLENMEIEAFLRDEFIGALNPWHAAPGGVGAVKVFVSYLDYEKAKKVVEQYENNLKENNNKH